MTKHGAKGGFALATLATITLAACASDPTTPQHVSDVAALEQEGAPTHGGMHGGMHHGARGGVLAFADSLGLSEVQREEIRLIHEASRSRTVELHEQMRAIAGVPADGPRARGERPSHRDRSALTDEQREAMRPLMAEMRAIRADTRERVREVLTPEQRERLDAHAEARRDRMRERMDRRGGGDMHRRRGAA